MRPVALLIISAAVLVLASTPAAAQVETGLHAMGLKGAYERRTQEDTVTLTRAELEGYYEFFVNSHLAIGPAFSVSHEQPDNNPGQTSTSFSGFVDVYMGNTSGKLVPF